MGKYIAFLRGINVSGQKKVPMAELRTVLYNGGLTDVKTYIQSGNVVFEGGEFPKKEMEVSIGTLIEEHFGFIVPVLVKSVMDLDQILRNNPYDNLESLESNKVYFVLLFQSPDQEKVSSFKEEHYPNEAWELVGDCIYLKCIKGYGNAKLNNNLIERKLGLIATTRNYRTMKKLCELAS